MFKPLNGRVLIEPEQAEKVSEHGIILAEAKENPVIGTVLTDGVDVKKGDRVVFSKFGYDEVELEKRTLFLVSEATILGIYSVDNSA